MELLGVGPLEIVFILLLVILFFSPKDIAGGARTVGKNLKKIAQSDTYRAVRQVSTDLRELPSRLIKEAELEDLQQMAQDLRKEAESEAVPPSPKEQDGAIPSAKEAATEQEKPAE
jgi:Sec-independent protein translocase protein TatA